MPLKIIAILLVLFEFVNLVFLIREEELFNPLKLNFTLLRVSLYLQFLIHGASLVSGVLLWFRRRIGLLLFFAAAALNFILLEVVTYGETGGFGIPRPFTWVPFVIVAITGVIYRKSFRHK